MHTWMPLPSAVVEGVRILVFLFLPNQSKAMRLNLVKCYSSGDLFQSTNHVRVFLSLKHDDICIGETHILPFSTQKAPRRAVDGIAVCEATSLTSNALWA